MHTNIKLIKKIPEINFSIGILIRETFCKFAKFFYFCE